jgi:hypothetical protein
MVDNEIHLFAFVRFKSDTDIFRLFRTVSEITWFNNSSALLILTPLQYKRLRLFVLNFAPYYPVTEIQLIKKKR